MTYFAGLDVSMEVTSVCVVDGKGTIVREAKVASSPAAISRWLGDTGLRVARVGLEAGPLAPWLYRGLLAAGLPAVCIETRRMKAFAAASPVKTDRKDARLIAQAIRAGLFRAVHIKSEDSQALRTLLRHRWTLLRRRRDLENACACRVEFDRVRRTISKTTPLASKPLFLILMTGGLELGNASCRRDFAKSYSTSMTLE